MHERLAASRQADDQLAANGFDSAAVLARGVSLATAGSDLAREPLRVAERHGNGEFGSETLLQSSAEVNEYLRQDSQRIAKLASDMKMEKQ